MKLHALLFVAIAMGGCAGSGSDGNAEGGAVSIAIAWPPESTSPTRVVPSAANSIVIRLQRTGAAPVTSSPLSRATKAWKSPKLPAGSYTLTATAYPTAAATGTPQAEGTSTVEIRSGATVSSSVTMGSRVTALTVSPSPVTVTMGETSQLAASATDSQGNVVLVAGDKIRWTSSDPAIARITATGLTAILTPIAAGSTTLVATFTEVDDTLGQQPVSSSDVPVTVSPVSTENGLANTAWPKYRASLGNAALTSGFGTAGIERWRIDSRIGYSEPVIGTDGTLFTCGADGKLYAIERTSGSVKWSVPAGTLTTSPSVPGTLAAAADGTIYCHATDGQLIAFDGASGSIKWTYNAGSFTQTYPVLGPNGVVYVATTTGVLAVKSGQLMWSFKGSGAGPDTKASLAMGPTGSLYFASRGALYAVSSQTGAKEWSVNLGSTLPLGTPSVGPSGLIYLCSGSRLYAVNSNGTPAWQYSIASGAQTVGVPAVDTRGTVYVSATVPSGFSTQNKLYAVDGASGSLVWSKEYGLNKRQTSASLAGDGTVVFAVGSTFYGVGSSDGTTKWSCETGSAFMRTDPILDADGSVFASFEIVGIAGGLIAIR